MAVFRFGCMPSGYGSALFIETFYTQLRCFVEFNRDIRPEVKYYVYEMLDKYILPAKNKEKDPIEELLHIYNNWLNAFPFDFPEYQSIRKEFANHSPLVPKLVQGEAASYYRLQTTKELVEWLNKQSKELFEKMKTSSIFVSAMVDVYESTIEKKQLDIEEACLLDKYIEEEQEYLITLQKWFNIQKRRFSIIHNQIPKIEDKEGKTSFDEAYRLICSFKDWIENKGGHKFFHEMDNLREIHFQELFQGICTMTKSSFRFDREINNGRGAVDFLVSKGVDCTVLEFKLASNARLKENLQYQVEIYKLANETDKAIIAIICFTCDELQKVHGILSELQINENKIIIIDCRNDKPSASKVRCEMDV